MSHRLLTPLPRQRGETSKDYAYRNLKQAIMSLRLVPGQTISELELAASLNMSRTPIREVLNTLREEHLIDVTSQVGTIIPKIQPQLIEEASFMRYVLEYEVMVEACHAFPRDSIELMRFNVFRQRQLQNSSAMAEPFHELDNEFHHLLFSGVGKPHVWQAIMRMSTHYNRMRLLFEKEHRFEEAMLQHETMLDVIERGDVSKVEDVITQHVMKPKRQWQGLIDDTSPYATYFDMTRFSNRVQWE